jgi:hypothetical protein
MTSGSSVFSFSALAGAVVLCARCAPSDVPNDRSRASAATSADTSARGASSADWTLQWTHIDPATPVRTFSVDSAGVVSRVINATPRGVLDTLPRSLVEWAARGIDQARLCTLKSEPADWRLDVSLTADGRTCTVARSAAAWQREVRGRRVIAIVDSLEKVACGTRCSPFE